MSKLRLQKKTLEHDLFDKPIRALTINSKNKGDSNERECCKWLYKWTGKRFIRTPSSGGRRLENNSSFCGDVVCEDEKFNFRYAVETKHLANLKISHGDSSSYNSIYKIWQQAQGDAVRALKAPLVMVRVNGQAKGVYMICTTDERFVSIMFMQDVPMLRTYSFINGETIYAYSSVEVLQVPYAYLY